MPSKHTSTRKKTNHSQRRIFLVAAGVSYLILAVLIVEFFVSSNHYLSLQVQDSKTTSESVDVFQAEPGYRFVIVNILIEHKADSPRWFAPVTQSYIKDDAGNQYSMAPYRLNDPFKADVYAPDTPAKGELSYAVPKTAQGLRFCYELDQHKVCRKI